jgi:uncharacterized SAM-binding protein YcdF (DUF218 family)
MYRFLGGLACPDRLLLLALMTVLAIAWRRHPEFRKTLLWILLPTGLWLLLSMPIVSHVAAAALEGSYRPLAVRPARAGAIVVLSGCAFPRDENRLAPVLCEDSIYRCLAAADLYQSGGPCPVVVSGGIVSPEDDMPALAVMMRDFLVRLGVPATEIVVEDRSTWSAGDCSRNARSVAWLWSRTRCT